MFWIWNQGWCSTRMAGRCLQCRQRSGFSYLPLWKSTFLLVFQLLRALREVGQGLNLKRGVRASRRLSWPGLGWPELAGKVTGKLAWNLQNNKTGEFFLLLVTLLAAGDGSGVGGTRLQWQFFLMHLGKQQRQVVAGKRLPLLLLYWVFERGCVG